MDFRQIEAFVSVYRLRNFSRAGKALYLTQPTISSHISDLENELNVKLFDRSSRDVLPTSAGNIFYQYAINLLETRDSAVCSLHKYGSQIEGRLEIAASTIPGQYLLPRIISGFRQKYPNIMFLVHQADTRKVIMEIQEKKYQIGIVGTRIDEEKVAYEVLSADNLVLISDRKGINGWEGNSNLPLATVLNQPFILREQGSGTRREFEAALKKKGIDPDKLKVIAEMNSTEAIKQAVHEGLGISVVSFLSVEDYLNLGLIRAYAIDELDLKRSFYLVTRKNFPLSPSVEAFQEYILEYFNNTQEYISRNKK